MALDRIRAPYNFVPLSDTIVRPDWGERVSHDVPFSDALCVTLDLRLIAKTPLFVRGAADETRFLELPDGRRAVPGSSLRGMLRNVVEIASFGRMERIADRKFGVRDLRNRDLYGDRMAELSSSSRFPVPLVGAGWLRLDDDGVYDDDAEGDGARRWSIEPCNFAKVHYQTLMRLAEERGIRGFEPGRKQSAPDKYEQWGTGPALEATLPVEVLKTHGTRSKKGVPRIGDFGVVPKKDEDIAKANPECGALVFTGQPMKYDVEQGPKGKNDTSKRHDFFFFGSAGAPLPVSLSRRRDFEFIHSDTGQQHRQDVGDPNEEWGFWKPRLEGGEKIPVFFLANENGELESFGLAMMFRLAYRHSPRDLVRRHQEGWDDNAPDLADLIFGYVRTTDGETKALRGRAAIETAPELDTASELPEVLTVLGSPKASFYPSYVAQEGLGRDSQYKTYMDDDANIAGWKRYQQRIRALAGDELPPLPTRKDGSTNRDVATAFRPISVGAVFETRLRVHNLRPAELGALLWATEKGPILLEQVTIA